MEHQDHLPPEQELALAYAQPTDRSLIGGILALDRGLGRAVAAASEPIVGQLRLAWWRDALGARPDQRPRGNPQFDELAAHFGERLHTLVALVDGWEAILLADGSMTDAVEGLLEGRVQAWLAVSEALECGGHASAVSNAARFWAVADVIAGIGDPAEHSALLALGRTNAGRPAQLPRRMRPLAVLAALSRHAIARGGEPLLAGRISALVALRAGMFGR